MKKKLPKGKYEKQTEKKKVNLWIEKILKQHYSTKRNEKCHHSWNLNWWVLSKGDQNIALPCVCLHIVCNEKEWWRWYSKQRDQKYRLGIVAFSFRIRKVSISDPIYSCSQPPHLSQYFVIAIIMFPNFFLKSKI